MVTKTAQSVRSRLPDVTVRLRAGSPNKTVIGWASWPTSSTHAEMGFFGVLVMRRSTERQVIETYLAFMGREWDDVPPPHAVANGSLELNELTPLLVELHDSSLTYAMNKTPGAPALVRKLGSTGTLQLSDYLMGKLAETYGVSILEVMQAKRLLKDVSALFDPALQPMIEDGVDGQVLKEESDALLRQNAHISPYDAVDAYASPSDPRLPCTLSRVSFGREGIAWVTLFRPQHFSEFDYREVRKVYSAQEAGRWHFILDGWRKRTFWDPEDSYSWRETISKMKDASSQAGLRWTTSFSAYRKDLL